MKRIIRPISGNARDISLETASFTKNLSALDDTVQKALDKLDKFDVPVSSFIASKVSVATSGFNGRLAPTDDTVQKALDRIDDISAGDIPLNTAGYSGNLNSTHNTVQKMADVVNAMSVNGISEWSSGVLYRVGANAIFMGLLFRCSVEHTSAASFDLNNWITGSPYAIIGTATPAMATLQCVYSSGGVWRLGSPGSGETLPTHVVIYTSGTKFIAVSSGRYTIPAHGKSVGYYYAAQDGGMSTTKGSPYEASVLDAIDSNTVSVMCNTPAVKYAAPVGGISYGREFTHSFSNTSLTSPLKYDVILPQDVDYSFVDMDISIRLVTADIVAQSYVANNTTPGGTVLSTMTTPLSTPLGIYLNDIETVDYLYSTISGGAATATGNATATVYPCIPMAYFTNSASTNMPVSYCTIRGSINNGGFPTFNIMQSKPWGTGTNNLVPVFEVASLRQVVKVTKITLMVAANMQGQLRIKIS